MRKISFVFIFFAVWQTAFAQDTPPLVNISQFIYGGTPEVGKTKRIGTIYDSERKHVLLTVYCRNFKDDYGWLYTPYTIYNYDDVNEHITIPVRSDYTYHGYTVWYRIADLTLPDNVRIIDFEPSYLNTLYLTISKNSKIEEIHIPQSVTNLTIKVAKEYQGDVVFFMESDNPQFKDGFAQSYYEPDYKKCVFIVPKGSVERYNSIGRFQYARIYESMEEYRSTKTSENSTVSNHTNNNNSATRSTSEMRDEYIDLGLPSGTLWKSRNENGYFSYDIALSRFRNQLPSYEQIKELKTKCQWKWTDGGYIVTGPNGNSFFLPAEGYVHPSNNGDKTWEQKVGGHYWAEKRYGEHLTELRFSSDWIVINVGDGCLEKIDKASIRLVKTR